MASNTLELSKGQWTENRLLLSAEMAQQLRHSVVGNMMVQRYKQGKGPYRQHQLVRQFFWNNAGRLATHTLFPYCIAKTYLFLPAALFGLVRNSRSSFELCFWCVEADLPFVFGMGWYLSVDATHREKVFFTYLFSSGISPGDIILRNLPSMQLIPRIHRHKWSNML